SAVADRTRARMLCALMDGRAYTATEMSLVGGVSASTASAHLRVLVEQGMIECVPQGRHRYFRIASPEVAETLESIMGLAAKQPSVQRRTPAKLRFARTCYDHMAGVVAVALHDRLIALGWLNDDSSSVSDIGRAELNRIGIHFGPPTSRRRFAFGCLDWSERRAHSGGQLGAAILATFETKRWVIRRFDSRELVLTAKGSKALNDHFGLNRFQGRMEEELSSFSLLA
ncbi:MAG TPA: winged helix-turn-helix domain-containing protein, partial [Terriglobales bacterium]|nr:winged helix-turn-helix domain-containing protein [Terriglobales bacterium]